MDRRPRIRRGVQAYHVLVAGVACALLIGCPVPPDDPSGNLDDGNEDTSLTSPLGKTSGEPNGTFDGPVVAVFVDDVARVQGTVALSSDLDVFLFGPLDAGSRIVVDASTPDSFLDVSIAIFDDSEEIVFENDDRGGYGSRVLDSYIDFVVRHSGERYYMVVTRAAFAAAGDRTGSYHVTVTRSGAEVPDPAPQVLFLDFDGGHVESPVLGTHDLLPFDAAEIAAIYDGQTETVKQSIVDTMRQNYERFDVQVVTSDDGPPPSGMRVSTIYFGGFNPDAYGIAENVDLYNSDFCDDAIIFTETFDPRLFSSDPSAEEMGLAIGNVAAHEAGHVLGLNHTDDDRELMDDQSAADAFLFDQEFFRAPLSSDIMPIGFQDASVLLTETVGPSGSITARRVATAGSIDTPAGASMRTAQRPAAIRRMVMSPKRSSVNR